MTLASAPQPGRVVTFYSYKGGTGRSMALANTAWILAANGQRVLVIDWDLEAPGLHRYFGPYLRDAKLEASDGLMDFVLAFADAALTLPDGIDEADRPAWFEKYSDLGMFAYAVNWPGFERLGGRLDFVPAGRQDAGYSLRVNSFNWQHFYLKLGGGIFLEAVKRSLRRDYDYILIDSRTGVSDTSGVCTVQMPDTLVVCFTLNEQSIQGAAGTAASALAQRRGPSGKSTLRVMPVPTRVDSSEKERVDAARSVARARFDGFLDWLDDDQLGQYWGDVEIPYIPFYSLEEVLAVFDRPHTRTSLLPPIEGLVSWVSEQRITGFPTLDEEERREAMARYLRPVTVPTVAVGGQVFFVSCAVEDLDPTLRAFLDELANEVGSLLGTETGRTMFLDARDVKGGDGFVPRIAAAIDACGVVLCVLSPRSTRSRFVRQEVDYARGKGKAIVPIEWVPFERVWGSDFSSEGEQVLRSPGQRGFRYFFREANPPALLSALYPVAERIAATWREGQEGGWGASHPAQPSSTATIVVPIVAERRRVMQQVMPKADNYGLRRRDWIPFPVEADTTAGELVMTAASQCDVTIRLVSIHQFRKWVEAPPLAESALILIDALTAERPEYDRQLRTWNDSATKGARVIACVPDVREEPEYLERYTREAQRPVAVVGTLQGLRRALREALADLASRRSVA